MTNLERDHGQGTERIAVNTRKIGKALKKLDKLIRQARKLETKEDALFLTSKQYSAIDRVKHRVKGSWGHFFRKLHRAQKLAKKDRHAEHWIVLRKKVLDNLGVHPENREGCFLKVSTGLKRGALKVSLEWGYNKRCVVSIKPGESELPPDRFYALIKGRLEKALEPHNDWRQDMSVQLNW